MTDSSALTVGATVRARPSIRPRALAGQRQGERLAVLTTAVAVGLIPLAVPAGAANAAPIDLLMAIAIGACLFWAGSTGHKWRFPYGIALVLFLAGGALGGLVGPVPRLGAIALESEDPAHDLGVQLDRLGDRSFHRSGDRLGSAHGPHRESGRQDSDHVGRSE